jgi:ketosteroid isomerase-like protein
LILEELWKARDRSKCVMSERTNTDVVQQGYEAFGRGDIPAVLDLLTDDVEWIQQGPSVIPFAGTRHGHEGVAEYFSVLDENLEFEQFEPREFVAQGDTVVVGFERSVSVGRAGAYNVSVLPFTPYSPKCLEKLSDKSLQGS